MDDQQVSGKTDVLEQRLPAPIGPAEKQRDKRFEVFRLSMVVGEVRVLRFRVQPDTYMIAAATGGSLEVCLGPVAQVGQTIPVPAASWVRIAGVDHFLTVTCVGANVEGYVLAEAGYPDIGAGAF